MEAVNEAMATGSSMMASNKFSLIMYYIKKYLFVIIPSLSVMAVCIVVMAMTKPLTGRETVVALISTFFFAVCGSAGITMYFHIEFPETLTGALAHGGLIALSGVPGWVFIRACFNWSDVNNKKTIIDLIKQIKAALK